MPAASANAARHGRTPVDRIHGGCSVVLHDADVTGSAARRADRSPRVGRVEDEFSGRAQGRVQRALQHRIVGDAGELKARRRHREIVKLAWRRRREAVRRQRRILRRRGWPARDRRTATIAARPTASRWPSSATTSSPAPGVRIAARTAFSAVPARRPCSRARARTAFPPASSWNPPALLTPTLRTSGVPGKGRKPTSPAPPVAPRCRRPSITTAAPIPSSPQSRTKSSLPAGRADAQLRDRREVHVVVDLDRDPERVLERGQHLRVVPAGQVARIPQAAGRADRTRPASRP